MYIHIYTHLHIYGLINIPLGQPFLDAICKINKLKLVMDGWKIYFMHNIIIKCVIIDLKIEYFKITLELNNLEKKSISVVPPSSLENNLHFFIF